MEKLAGCNRPNAYLGYPETAVITGKCTQKHARPESAPPKTGPPGPVVGVDAWPWPSFCPPHRPLPKEHSNRPVGPSNTRVCRRRFSRNEGPTGPRRTQTARTGVRWQCQARHAERAKKAAAPFSIARRVRVDDRPEQDGAEQGRLRQRPGRQPAVRKAGPRRRAIPPRNARTRPPRSRRSWPRLVLRKGRGDSRAHPFVDLGVRAVVVREKPRRRPCTPLASTTPRPEEGGGSGPSQSGATRREGAGISNPLRILAVKAADPKKSWRAGVVKPREKVVAR